jgi:hypothetical protein
MAEVGDVLAGTSLAEADDSAIEARLRELEERYVAPCVGLSLWHT